MSGMTLGRLNALRNRHPTLPRPQAFVETGTFHGKTTEFAQQIGFNPIHTIELDEKLYAATAPRIRRVGTTCWLGDSRDILPALLSYIDLRDTPTLFYLDAHWFERLGVPQTPLPLLAEIEMISKRPPELHDVIVVDDVVAFGKAPGEPGAISKEWAEVTQDSIKSYFPGFVEATVRYDQFAVYR